MSFIIGISDVCYFSRTGMNGFSMTVGYEFLSPSYSRLVKIKNLSYEFETVKLTLLFTSSK